MCIEWTNIMSSIIASFVFTIVFMNKVSVIIPCYNDTNFVKKTVTHTLRVFDGDVEIIVSAQTDFATIAKMFNGDPRITVHNSTGTNRSQTLNQWATIATGDLFVFLHADSILDRNAGWVLRNLDTNQYVYGGFSKCVSPSFRVVDMLLFWDNWSTKLIGEFWGDNAIFATKPFFEQVGQFPDIPAFEDVQFSYRAKKLARHLAKKRIFLDYPTITSGRKFVENGPWVMTRKFIYIRLLYMCGVSPHTLHKIYSRYRKN